MERYHIPHRFNSRIWPKTKLPTEKLNRNLEDIILFNIEEEEYAKDDGVNTDWKVVQIS